MNYNPLESNSEKLSRILDRIAPQQIWSEDDNFIVIISDDFNLLKKIQYYFNDSDISLNGQTLALYIPMVSKPPKI